MRFVDIKKRERFKSKIKSEISELEKEIKLVDLMDDSPRTIIGEATALSDLDDEVKEKIFKLLEFSFKEERINLNKNRILELKNRLRDQLKTF
jgi:hypothetical protein